MANIDEAFPNDIISGTGVYPVEIKVKVELSDDELELKHQEMVKRKEKEAKQQMEIEEQLGLLKTKITDFKVQESMKFSVKEQEHLFKTLFSGDHLATVNTLGTTELSKKLNHQYFLDFSNYSQIFNWEHEKDSDVSRQKNASGVKGSFYAKLVNERYVKIVYKCELDLTILEWTSTIDISYSEDMWGIVDLVSDPIERLEFVRKHKPSGWFS